MVALIIDLSNSLEKTEHGFLLLFILVSKNMTSLKAEKSEMGTSARKILRFSGSLAVFSFHENLV